MVEQLIWEREPSRELRSPILVTAWDGLFDVGGAATGAVEVLRSSAATKVGYIDADEFFDFNERRPHVKLDDNGRRQVVWPHNDIYCLPSMTETAISSSWTEWNLIFAGGHSSTRLSTSSDAST